MAKKILFTILALTLILTISPLVLAERYENNLFKYGEVDPNGNLVITSTPVENVNILGFVCSSSNCATVSKKLWTSVLNSGTSNPKDFIQLIYPTTLQSPYGYGIYMYKQGYLPYEVSADWWGTCPSCDPQGPYNNYLTKKQVCESKVNSMDAEYNEETERVYVSANIRSPISHAGPLDYVPPELIVYYSGTANVNLEVIKDSSVYYTETKTLTLEFSKSSDINFEFSVEGEGEYKIYIYTTLDNEEKCLSYTESSKNKTIIIEEPPECIIDSDCGIDYCDGWQNYCLGDDAYRLRNCYDYECVSETCELTTSVESELVEECNYGCADGECLDECSIDSDCGTDYYSDNYCLEEFVYKDFHDFFCEDGQCGESVIPELLDICEYGCVNGECQSECSEDVDCGIDYCDDWQNYCDSNDLYKQRTCYDYKCSSGTCELNTNIETQLLEHCNYGCDNGQCQPQPPECTCDGDCQSDYYSDNYCFVDSIYKDFHDFFCDNGQCGEDIISELVSVCDYGCENGECQPQPPECVIDEDCGIDHCDDWQNYCENDNVYQQRTCYDYECVSGTCELTTSVESELVEQCDDLCVNGECVDVECYINTDCGIDQCAGEDNYCFNDNVYQDFIFFTCNNPGTAQSYCSNNIAPILLEDCGTDYCDDWEFYCADGNSYKQRTCYDKGCGNFGCFTDENTETQLVEECDYGCENGECQPQPPECTQDSDCGIDYCDDWQNYCENDNAYKQRTCYDYQCDSGTCELNTNIETKLLETCDYGCADGQCLQQCTCDGDCGTDYYSDNYCLGDSVYKDFHDFFCDNEICNILITQELVEECDYGCDNGECNPEPLECTIDSDCGIDYCDGWQNYCDSNDLYKQRTCYDYQCNSGTCELNTNVETQLVKECDYGCENAQCKENNNNGNGGGRSRAYDPEDDYNDELVKPTEIKGLTNYSFIEDSVQKLSSATSENKIKSNWNFNWFLIIVVIAVIVLLILIIIIAAFK